jgi:DNA-binding NarL/FixJ family response regulator
MPKSSRKTSETQPTKKVGILIVDDHPIIRAGLSAMIDSQPDLEVCGEAADMAEAMQVLIDQRPELAIVNLSAVGASGLELVREILKRQPDTKILVCSMHDESLYAERVLRIGAKGYIHKMEATSKIMEAIRCVQSGKTYLSDKMTEVLASRSVRVAPVAESRDPVDHLSDRELEVFELIGKCYSVNAIAEKMHLSPKTIEIYRDSIKSKLNLDSNRQVIQQAIHWLMEQD